MENSFYSKGLVSVIIPTYKRSELICRTIDSVLSQTYQNFECIVVNDNEKNDDFSVELYKSIDKYFIDNRFVFIEQDKHINGAVARNIGIRAAKGEFIAFLDDDDYWTNDKIELQVKYLQEHGDDIGAVTCLSKMMYGSDIIRASIPHKEGSILYKILCRDIAFGTGSTLIRRETLDKAGYFDESLIRHQDLQLFANLAHTTKIGLIKRHMNIIESKYSTNRVSIEKLKNVKKEYFKSINNVLDSLKPFKKKNVFIMHDFELGYILFSGGEKKKGIKKMCRIFASPSCFYMAVKRVFIRGYTSKFRKHILKKYNGI